MVTKIERYKLPICLKSTQALGALITAQIPFECSPEDHDPKKFWVDIRIDLDNQVQKDALKAFEIWTGEIR
jgi:hypothetical protein